MNPRGARKCYVIRVLCVAQTGSVLHSPRRDVRPRLSARPASLVLVFARSGESLPGLLQQRQRARSGAQREMTAKCCEGGRVAGWPAQEDAPMSRAGQAAGKKARKGAVDL